MKCFLVTSLGWVAFIAIIYSYAVTNQYIIIPNQRGYMEVRNDNISLTPASFEADVRKNNQLDDLVGQVTQK